MNRKITIHLTWNCSSTIHFSCKFNEEARGYIAISIKDIEDNSCIMFRPAITADLHWIEIDDNGKGCMAIYIHNYLYIFIFSRDSNLTSTNVR